MNIFNFVSSKVIIVFWIRIYWLNCNFFKLHDNAVKFHTFLLIDLISSPVLKFAKRVPEGRILCILHPMFILFWKNSDFGNHDGMLSVRLLDLIKFLPNITWDKKPNIQTWISILVPFYGQMAIRLCFLFLNCVTRGGWWKFAGQYNYYQFLFWIFHSDLSSGIYEYISRVSTSTNNLPIGIFKVFQVLDCQ